jgi:hypothetical protein
MMRRSISKLIYVRACPMCDESYTVGPHMYHRTLLPDMGMKGTFVRVKEFLTIKGYAFAARSDRFEAIVGIRQFKAIAAARSAAEASLLPVPEQAIPTLCHVPDDNSPNQDQYNIREGGCGRWGVRGGRWL